MWLVWAAVALPAALGLRTFTSRDVFSNNFPQKAFGAAELQAGRIPALNPAWALGQPFRGNPAALAFYPGNLLYLVLPFWSAFNLHFVLHWLLALFGMRALARALGLGRGGALFAAITYAGGGFFLSTLTFYNLVAVAAWWPWVMAFALCGDRRGMAAAGLACGLALLAGEPVTAALGLLPLFVALASRHGWRRALGISFVVGLVGLAVALPQIVATARVLPFSFRGDHGVFASQAVSYHLPARRFLELVLPLPYGWPLHQGRMAIWGGVSTENLWFFHTLYVGLPALALALASRHRVWLALAGAGLLLAWAAGSFPALLTTLSFGLFRFPEKLLLWPALALPLAAAWGFERLGSEAPRRFLRLGLLAGGLALLAAAALFVVRPRFVAHAEAARTARALAGDPAAIVGAQLGLLGLYAALAGALLLVVVWAVHVRRPAGLLAAQLTAVLQLFPLLGTDEVAFHRGPFAWETLVGPGAAVVNTNLVRPAWHDPPRYPAAPEGPRTMLQRSWSQDLHPAPGTLHGLTYPLAPNLEGMNSPLCTFLEINLERLDWPMRVRWFRVVGLDYFVTYVELPELDGVEPVETVVRQGQPTHLLRVQEPAPAAWWPEATVVAPNPVEALRWVSFRDDAVTTVVTSQAVEHVAGGKVALTSSLPDRLELEVSSEGGLAVIRRAWHPLLEARTATGERLTTLPVDLLLLGVVVPPGEQRVVLAVRQGPEIAAGLFALLVAALALVVAWRPSP